MSMPKGTATQTFVALKEIRDGIAILKDGSFRAIVMVSSINYELKSADERAAILTKFQNFLNTIDFSVQLYVQSRRLDIGPYIELLATREAEQENDLMKTQLREYMGFIQTLTESNDIMTKNFFIVVPYSPAALPIGKGIKSAMGTIFGKTGQRTDMLAADAFEEHRSQLEQRLAIVEQGLAGIGIRSVVLGTNEIIDLFYHIFNPEEGRKALPE
jgi:type IV secretory pathway VirB4 component